MNEIEIKLNRLIRELRLTDGSVIAFSGGLLSTFLAAVARKMLDRKIYAVTVMAENCPYNECLRAREKAERLGLEHFVLDVRGARDDWDLKAKAGCAFCDELQHKLLKRWVKEQGFRWVLEGSCEAFDTGWEARQERLAVFQDYRKRPFVFAGLEKEDIIAIAHGWGLGVEETSLSRQQL